jgi:hypothetical protein
MNEQTSSNTPSGDEKHEIVLDLGYEVCDSIPMSGNQLISELQGKVAYHERELAIWKAALESALRSEGKRKSSPSPHGEMKVSASVEMSPSPYIIGVIRANEHAGITSTEIKSTALTAKLPFANEKGFPYKQLNRLKRTGKVKNENGRYFLAR